MWCGPTTCVLFVLDSQVAMTSEWRSDSKNMDGSWQIERKLENKRTEKQIGKTKRVKQG